MPQIFDPNKEEQAQQQGGGAAPAPGGVIGGGQSGTIAGNAAPAAPGGASPASGAPTRSGNWTNLQQYVTANQGAGQKLAEKATAATTAAGTAAQQATGALKTQATDDISKGTYRDKSLVGDIYSNTAAVGPDRYAASQNAAYKGPNAASEVKGYADTQAKVTAAGTVADQLAGSHTDRASALGRADVAGRPSYTLGERNLDSFLLGADKAGRAAVDQAKAQYGTGSMLQGEWQTLPGWMEKMTGNAKAEIDALRNGAKGARDDLLGKATTAIEGAGKKHARDQAADQDLYDKFSSWDPAALEAAGIDAGTAAVLQQMGVDPKVLLSVGRERTLGDAVDPETAAQYAALMAMGGETPAFDLSRSEGGAGVALDTKTIPKAQQAAALYGELGDLFKNGGANATAARADPEGWLRKNGVDPDALRAAGIDPATAIKYSGVTNSVAAGYGKLGQWNELAALLGIGNQLDKNATAYERAEVSPAALAALKKVQNAPAKPIASAEAAAAGAVTKAAAKTAAAKQSAPAPMWDAATQTFLVPRFDEKTRTWVFDGAVTPTGDAGFVTRADKLKAGVK